MHKHVRAVSMHVAYIPRSFVVYALIQHVDSEIAAADWFAEETRGCFQRWGPRLRNTYMDALSGVLKISQV